VLNHTGHIVPASIDIKVNMLPSDSDFGLTVKLSKIEKSKEFILFDGSSWKMISMTQELHKIAFSSLN